MDDEKSAPDGDEGGDGSADPSPPAVPPDTEEDPTAGVKPLAPEIVTHLLREEEFGRELISSLVSWQGRMPPPGVMLAYPEEDRQRIRAEFDEQRAAEERAAIHEIAAENRILDLEAAKSERDDKGLDADIAARKDAMRNVMLLWPAVLLTVVIVAVVGFATGNGYPAAILGGAITLGGALINGQMGARGTTDVEIEGVKAQAGHASSVTPGLSGLRQALPGGKESPPQPPAGA